MVGRLVLKQKRDKNFLRSLVNEDLQEQNVKGILCNTVERLLLSNVKLDNATIIQKEIDEKHKVQVPLRFIQ